MASAACMTLHDALAAMPAGRVADGAVERIRALRLQTAAPLDAMRGFYGDTLGMRVLSRTQDELTVAGGTTTITFVATDRGAPFYHFAFNIPERKILAAREWQRQHTPLFKTPRRQIDSGYPDDVRHFRSWNAHSVFFFDPAENVVEHIARHDLPSTNDLGSPGDAFTPEDILYASEIAFASDRRAP